MAGRYHFQGHVLRDAVSRTFGDREAGRMVARRDGYWEGAFDTAFAQSRLRGAWEEWLKEHSPIETPSLEETVASVSRFAMPLLTALRDRRRFDRRWSSPKGWSKAATVDRPKQLNLSIPPNDRS